MISPLIKPIVKIATQACRTKLSQAAPAIRLAVCREVHLKQAKDADDDIEAALVPLFEAELRSIAKGLLDIQERGFIFQTKTALENALSAIDLVFNPKDWDEPLVNAAAPPLVITTGRAARSQLILMGVDPTKTTATDWLEDQDDVNLEDIVFDAPQGRVAMRIATEWPPWMKKQIKVGLKESFSQPYWAKVNETTRADVGKFVERGLLDGQSIETMARRMQPELLEEGIYARRRARNIARTESGNALNSGRRMSIDKLKDELGPEVPLTASWLSVLGNTTRDNHAHLHQVLADPDGLWSLGSVRVPWPSHFSLAAGERINCFPGDVLVEGDFVGAQCGRYDGIFTEIVLRKGGRITVTPHHPIVTSKGIVPACEIHPDQKVMTYRAKAEPSAFSATGCDEKQNEPVSIEKVFQTIHAAGTRTGGVKITGSQVDDFYGDGRFFDGDVQVVRPNWELLKDGEFGQFEKRGDSIFALESFVLSAEARQSSGGFGFGGVGTSSSGGPCLAEPLLGCTIGSVTPSGSLAIGVASDFNSRLDQSAANEGPGISGFLADALKRYSRSVSFDDVVEIRNFHSAGHVYDLQSRYGTILARSPNGQSDYSIVTGNCQCTVVHEFGIPDAEAQDAIQEAQEPIATETTTPDLSFDAARENRRVAQVVGRIDESAVGLDDHTRDLFGIELTKGDVVSGRLAESGLDKILKARGLPNGLKDMTSAGRKDLLSVKRWDTQIGKLSVNKRQFTKKRVKLNADVLDVRSPPPAPVQPATVIGKQLRPPSASVKVQNIDMDFRGFVVDHSDVELAQAHRFRLDDARKHAVEAFDDLFKRNPGLSEIKGSRDVSVTLQSGTQVKTPAGSHVNGFYSRRQRRIGLAHQTQKPVKQKLTVGSFSVDVSRNGTLRHEYGHHIENVISDSKKRKWIQIEAKIQNKADAVSDYGSSIESEMFAESFSAYTHPEYGAGKRLPKAIEDFMADITGVVR